MIRQNLRFIFCNSKYLMGLLLLCLFTGVLLVYQEQNSKIAGSYRSECLNWAVTQENPYEAVKLARNQVYVPVDGKLLPHFTNSLFYDIVLLEDLSAYLKNQQYYKDVLTSFLENQKWVMDFPNATVAMKMKNAAAYQQYEKLYGQNVICGNFTGWEKFFDFGIIDIAICLIIFYTVYFLIIIEREKGMEHLMFATKNGGRHYFAVKAATVIIATIAVTMVLLGLKLFIYARLYGLADWNAALQSMEGYVSSPYALSICQYFVIFVLWKLIFTGVLALGALLVSSLPLSATGCALIIGGIVGCSWFLISRFPNSDIELLIRDANLFQLWNVAYWFNGFRYYCLGQVGDYLLKVQGLVLPANCLLIYLILMLLVGCFLYQRGLRKSGHKRFDIANIWKYRGNLWGNEVCFLALYRHYLILMLLLLIVACRFCFHFDVNYYEDVVYERELVNILNQQSFEDACIWLDHKSEELDVLEEQQMALLLQHDMGTISDDSFQYAYNAIITQLAIRPIIDQFQEQAQEIAACSLQRDIPCKFEYTALSRELYQQDGLETRLMIGILISIFLTFSILTVFPVDRQLGMHRLIGTVQYGNKSIMLRTFQLVIMTFFLATILQSIWIYSLNVQYQLVGWDTPIQSWEIYRNTKISITVGGAIILNIIMQGIKWAIFAALGIAISFLTDNVAWIQILGIIVFICPLALGIIGVEWINYIPYYRYLFFGGQDVFLSVSGNIILLLVMTSMPLIMKRGRQKWMEI